LNGTVSAAKLQQVTAVLGPGNRSISVLACNFTGVAADPGPVRFRYLVIEFS
jgi:hypothetical protein